MMARRRDEKGAILIVSTVFAFGALIMSALVMDLGQLRLDRRINKGITDMAARAGISQLVFGPVSGVCKARQYLLANSSLFSSYDAPSETWTDAMVPPTVKASPCASIVPNTPNVVTCQPNTPSTWTRFTATAGGGRFTITIQAGYVLPDPAYPRDTSRGDPGNPEQGGCDNLAVVLTQTDTPTFAKVGGATSNLVKVRSVGRLNSTESLDFIAALQLLEQTACNVLQTGGTQTKVIAQPYKTNTVPPIYYPGTIQIDSKGPSGTCSSPILNAGPGLSVVACNSYSNDPLGTGCLGEGGTRPGRIGIYAINFNKPAADVSSTFGTTYGENRAVPTPRTGRKNVDKRYRLYVKDLDKEVKDLLTRSSHWPPGCTTGNLTSSSTCPGSDGNTWLLVRGDNKSGNTPADCDNLAVFFAVSGRTAAKNIWFDCDLKVITPLTLSASASYIVVSGSLTIDSTFTITDPRKVYVGGTDSGNSVGLQVTGASSVFNMNTGGQSSCSARRVDGAGQPLHIANRLVVGKGSFKVGSGATARMCQTFVYMASSYDKVPASNGVYPCPGSSCDTYTGTVSVVSGAALELTAANEMPLTRPEGQAELDAMPFEDIALWTEAGGPNNGLTGGANNALQGVYFLPNASQFTLTGNSAQAVSLGAQFIATTMKVAGNGTLSLVPNPNDSVSVTIYTTLLVR